MDQRTDTAYRVGRLLGSGYIWIVVLVVLVFAAVFLSNYRESRVRDEQAARARAAELSREAALQKRCTEGIDAVVTEGRAALNAGDPDKGLAIMNRCANKMADVTALAFHKEVLIAARAKAASAAKAAQEQALLAQRADLARRKKEGVRVGMSVDDVLKSSWGKPERINRSTNARGTREQWVYPGHHNYLYFENDVLTNIQH